VAISILWVDLVSSVESSGLSSAFGQWASVESFDDPLTRNYRKKIFDLICFELDFPDLDSLSFLKKTSLEWPDVPVLMISSVHSEALAVWALRLRVWEYLVAPVKTREIESVIASLAQGNANCSGKPPHHSDRSDCSMPVDCRYRNNNSQKSILMPALHYVHEHLHEKIKESDVAAMCNMTQFKFSRYFKGCYGSTFQEFLISMRMDKATKLLVNPNVLVADVAYQVGFKDPSYFTRAFKKVKGVSPRDCRGVGA